MAISALNTEASLLSLLNGLLWKHASRAESSVLSAADVSFPWAAALRRDYRLIREELHAFEGHPVEHWTGRPGWRQLLLSHLGTVDHAVAEAFPRTSSIVLGWDEAQRGAPKIVSAWFSVLEPNATLSTHVGEYKGIWRYHLGLEVPPAAADPAARRRQWVGEVLESWVPWLPPDRLPQVRGMVPHGGASDDGDDAGDDGAVRIAHGTHPALTGSRAHVVVFGFAPRTRPTSDNPMQAERVASASILEGAEGGDLLFDDTFPHYAVNHAHDARRVVLFIDVVRDDLPPLLDVINRLALWWVAPAVGVHAVGDGLANQAAMLRGANLPTDVAPWWARGRYRAAHTLRSAVGATALLVGAAGCWRRRRRRYAARAERRNKTHKIE